MPVGEDHIFPHDGVERTYKMYKPDNLAPGAPMVFVLHGMSSNSTWSYLTGFNDLAEEHGFLAVYPQSYLKLITFGKAGGKQDDSGKDDFTDFLGDKAKNCKEGETFTAMGMEILCQNGLLTTQQLRWNNENADHLFDGQSDVSFLTALAKSLQDEFDLSREKTFVAGFSNGGYMSYTLMCQASDVFAAAGVVAGLIDVEVLKKCSLDRPKPVIHIHGAEDGMVPISGEIDKSTGIAMVSAEDIVQYFANLNESVTTTEMQVTDNTTLKTYIPEGNGAEVHYYRIENHDHFWPGSDPGEKGYNDESGINASELIWSFFSRL